MKPVTQGGIMSEIATQADPTKQSSLRQMLKFWTSAAEELVPIRDDLAAMYREAGAAGIMEERALSIGIMIGYLESVMAKQPSRIAELGSLYSRLVEGERRAWEAQRKQRTPRAAGSSDLAQLANRPD